AADDAVPDRQVALVEDRLVGRAREREGVEDDGEPVLDGDETLADATAVQGDEGRPVDVHRPPELEVDAHVDGVREGDGGRLRERRRGEGDEHRVRGAVRHGADQVAEAAGAGVGGARHHGAYPALERQRGALRRAGGGLVHGGGADREAERLRQGGGRHRLGGGGRDAPRQLVAAEDDLGGAQLGARRQAAGVDGERHRAFVAGRPGDVDLERRGAAERHGEVEAVHGEGGRDAQGEALGAGFRHRGGAAGGEERREQQRQGGASYEARPAGVTGVDDVSQDGVPSWSSLRTFHRR